MGYSLNPSLRPSSTCEAYPRFFSSLDNACCWVADYLDWYNDKHLHSSIGYVTPNQKHSGVAIKIIDARNKVKQFAHDANTHRWSSKVAMLSDPQMIVLNPALERLDA